MTTRCISCNKRNIVRAVAGSKLINYKCSCGGSLEKMRLIAKDKYRHGEKQYRFSKTTGCFSLLSDKILFHADARSKD